MNEEVWFWVAMLVCIIVGMPILIWLSSFHVSDLDRACMEVYGEDARSCGDTRFHGPRCNVVPETTYMGNYTSERRTCVDLPVKYHE